MGLPSRQICSHLFMTQPTQSLGPRKYPSLQSEIGIQIILSFICFPGCPNVTCWLTHQFPTDLKCHLYHILNSQMCMGSICEPTVLFTNPSVSSCPHLRTVLNDCSFMFLMSWASSHSFFCSFSDCSYMFIFLYVVESAWLFFLFVPFPKVLFILLLGLCYFKLYINLGRTDTPIISNLPIHSGLLKNLKAVSIEQELVKFNPKYYMGFVAIINKMASSTVFSEYHSYVGKPYFYFTQPLHWIHSCLVIYFQSMMSSAHNQLFVGQEQFCCPVVTSDAPVVIPRPLEWW